MRLGLQLILIVGVMFVGGKAISEPFPDGYFSGQYERVGRTADGKLLDDRVRLSSVDGGFALSVCGDAVDLLPPLRLDFTVAFDAEILLTGREGPFQLWCQPHNDGQNFPILTCTSDGGARFTLWPLHDTFTNQDPPCPS
jgi:hypothetical protein